MKTKLNERWLLVKRYLRLKLMWSTGEDLLFGQAFFPIRPVSLLDPLNVGPQVGEPSLALLPEEVVRGKDAEDPDQESEGSAVNHTGSVAHQVRFCAEVV